MDAITLSRTDLNHSILIPTYMFADRICSETYRNALMDAIRKAHKDHELVMETGTVVKLYESGLQASQAARFGMQSIVHDMVHYPDEWLKGKNEAYIKAWSSNVEVIIDMQMELWRAIGAKPEISPDELTGCVFHDHKGGVKCSPKKRKSFHSPLRGVAPATMSSHQSLALEVLGSEIITIQIGRGESQQNLNVHKDALLRSRFFSAFLTSDFIEAREKKINLPEDHIEGVRCYIDWLYTRAMKYEKAEDQYSNHMWKFVDKVCDEAYGNEMMDCVIGYYQRDNLFMQADELVTLYKDGLRHCAAAKFGIRVNVHMMFIAAETWKKESSLFKAVQGFGDGLHELMEDFITEMMAYHTTPNRLRDPRKLKGCNFHEHKNVTSYSKAKDGK